MAAPGRPSLRPLDWHLLLHSGHAGSQDFAAVAALAELEMEHLSASAVTRAAALIGDTTFVSTVLPWTRAPSPPYVGARQAEQVEQAVDELVPLLADQGELVWVMTRRTSAPRRQPTRSSGHRMVTNCVTTGIKR